MPVPGRRALLPVVLVVAGLPGLTTPAVAAPAPSETGAGVDVHGRLLVVPSERPGGHTAYYVALADGDIVPVRGSFGAGVRSGDEFDGRLALPAGVVRTLAAHGESGPTDALRIVDRRHVTLQVSGTPSVTADAPAATPTTHQQYVAALDNEGALGQSDTQLLAHVSAVGTYWETQSDGAISGVGVPSTVEHFDTAVNTTDCGLGNDFSQVVQEALGKFPGIDVAGSDQLVLFVPPSCKSGGVVGMGSLGKTFASGGVLVVKAGQAIEGTYAHEAGHNYGFEHANARRSGTSMEYFGIYDVMGFAFNDFNQMTALSTPYRVFQGITQPGEIRNVDGGTTPVHASATIAPRSDDSGLRSVRVVDPDTGKALYLDYRSGTGEDAGSAYVAQVALAASGGITLHYAPGVVITSARGGSGVDDLVVDAAGDTSLGAGDAWRNASGTLVVHVASLGAAAHVTIDYLLRLATARPTITGTPRVGRTLTAKHGAWTPGTTFTYAWYAGGNLIEGRTGPTLRLTRAQQGKRISVKVTGTKSGYARAARTSARTAAVR